MRPTELTGDAPAKLNLALVVGPLRADGKHEVATLLQRVELCDTVTVRHADDVAVDGFAGDTIVTRALEALRQRTGQALSATIDKRIPVAAGLGGGSSDAATALRLGNQLLGSPHPADELTALAATLGSDVPFFLTDGAQLGVGDGTELVPQTLPDGYTVVVAWPSGAAKASTAEVYASFDERAGAGGFDERRRALVDALPGITRPLDLAKLPLNDLAVSPLAYRLLELGAFRADVTGAGPVVYGLFEDAADAESAIAEITPTAQTWLTRPRHER